MITKIERFISRGGYSSNTAAQYRRALLACYEVCGDFETLSPEALRAWLDGTGWGINAQWLALMAVRSFVRWAYGDNHAALDLRIKREETAPQRVLSLEQVRALLSSFDTGQAKGRRDLSLACLLLDSGLRVSEVCSLDVSRVSLVDRSLVVRVKGGRWDRAVYSDYTAVCLARWLADRDGIAQYGERALFVGIGGATPGGRMNPGGVRAVMRAWAARVPEIEALSPHDFRRTFATEAFRLGAPTRIIQKAGRWRSLAMVERYSASITADDVAPWFPVSAAMTLKRDV